MLAPPPQAGQPELIELCSCFCQCGKPPGTRGLSVCPACRVPLHPVRSEDQRSLPLSGPGTAARAAVDLARAVKWSTGCGGERGGLVAGLSLPSGAGALPSCPLLSLSRIAASCFLPSTSNLLFISVSNPRPPLLPCTASPKFLFAVGLRPASLYYIAVMA
jgi:hypothetical protein